MHGRRPRRLSSAHRCVWTRSCPKKFGIQTEKMMCYHTDYGRPARKSPSLHGRKSNPNPKFLSTAKAYFVCHIGRKFQITLIYAFIGCPQSVEKTLFSTYRKFFQFDRFPDATRLIFRNREMVQISNQIKKDKIQGEKDILNKSFIHLICYLSCYVLTSNFVYFFHQRNLSNFFLHFFRISTFRLRRSRLDQMNHAKETDNNRIEEAMRQSHC